MGNKENIYSLPPQKNKKTKKQVKRLLRDQVTRQQLTAVPREYRK